jgi:hypothetical protein
MNEPSRGDRAVPVCAGPRRGRSRPVESGARPPAPRPVRAGAARPGRPAVRIGRTTLDRWVRDYRRGGFQALVPRPRVVAPRTPAETLELAFQLKRSGRSGPRRRSRQQIDTTAVILSPPASTPTREPVPVGGSLGEPPDGRGDPPRRQTSSTKPPRTTEAPDLSEASISRAFLLNR